jgi:hypothetical protein
MSPFKKAGDSDPPVVPLHPRQPPLVHRDLYHHQIRWRNGKRKEKRFPSRLDPQCILFFFYMSLQHLLPANKGYFTWQQDWIWHHWVYFDSSNFFKKFQWLMHEWAIWNIPFNRVGEFRATTAEIEPYCKGIKDTWWDTKQGKRLKKRAHCAK